MKPVFDVLNPNLLIQRDYILEASAGTGKTFSIENIYVRLLIEDPTLSVDEILVVTFTKAATKELRERILAAMSRAAEAVDEIPFLQPDANPNKVKILLERAIGEFENAKISTIHSFCERSMKEYKDIQEEKEPIQEREIAAVVRNFYRLALNRYNPEEIDAVLSYFSGVEKFETFLVGALKQGIPVHEECKTALLSPPELALSMLADCQKLLDSYLQNRNKFRYDDILKAMLEQTESEEFCQRLRKQVKAAIIDEFQDTDQVQWKIFNRLFRGYSHLYLVGDPKQSIYAFRQADIYTYLQAGKELGEEAHYTLNTNYRSRGEMVEGLNALFSRAKGFIALPKTGNFLPYLEVLSGTQKGECPFADGKEAIHFCIGKAEKGRSRSWPPKKYEEETLFPWLVREIFSFGPSFNWAVLVKDRHQSQRVKEYLEARGISCRTQKEISLIDTPYFRGMKILIRSLLNPKDLSAAKAALGGIFIRLPYSCLVEGTEVHPLLAQGVELLSELAVLAEEKGFSAMGETLFRAEFEGKTVGETIAEIGEEALSAWLQICEYLDDLGQKGISLAYEHLLALEEGNIEGATLKQPRKNEWVSILTMHMSKGLEFDVVFALSLASRHEEKKEIVAVECQGRHVLTTNDDPLAEKQELENQAEKGRQLYVAMTRAKYRLYVPIVLDERGIIDSPIEQFISRFSVDFFQWLREEGKKHHISTEDLFAQEIPRTSLSQGTLELIPPETIVVPKQSSITRSFSGLMKGHVVEVHETPPHNFENPEKNPHTIPAGKEFGTLFHTIMECLPFGSIEKDHLSSYVRERVKGTKFAPWQRAIEEILEPLLFSEHFGLVLGELKQEEIYREIEFLYSEQGECWNGIIDFVCIKEGLYYILDWKTNWLGPNAEAYSRERLERAMEDHCYHLQAEIYRQALKKYIALVDSRPFEECFGGVIYIFVRGGGYVQSS